MRASGVENAKIRESGSLRLSENAFVACFVLGQLLLFQGPRSWLGRKRAILELRASGTGVQSDVHSLRERLELASGGAQACALSEPHISHIRQMCILASPIRAGEEAGQRFGFELQGVPRPSALHPSCSWVSTQPAGRGRMLACGDALVR